MSRRVGFRLCGVLLVVSSLAVGWDPAQAEAARTSARAADGSAPTLMLNARRAGASRRVSRRLPSRTPLLSLDVRLAPRSSLVLDFGGRRGRLTVRRGRGRTLHLDAGAGRRKLSAGGRRGWRHLALGGRPAAVSLDGKEFDAAISTGRSLSLEAGSGRVQVRGFIATDTRDSGGLLLHRLAELRARTAPGTFPLGTGADGSLRFARGWTGGFWPGALWQGRDLARDEPLLEAWALDATLEHFGEERLDTHDLGFMYGRSSVAAHERLCRSESRRAPARTCRLLRVSALDAARTLMRVARSNAKAGMIPTRRRPGCSRCASDDEADVLLDAMMNLPLLYWAARESGRTSFRDVAARHAHAAARLFVRADGSSFQSAHFRRSDGYLLGLHTHQGRADDSTWSRGQAWGIYGFTQSALALEDRSLLAVAERMASYVEARLPSDHIPRFDYEAGPDAPRDTSAGVITAAGLYRLGAACSQLGSCARGGAWRPLADRMLAASLTRVSARPPFGALGDQVYTLGGRSRWDDSGEFVFGLDYALEAVNLSLGRAAS